MDETGPAQPGAVPAGDAGQAAAPSPAPWEAYGAPPPTYTPPPFGYGTPPAPYGTPPPAYGAPTSGVQAAPAPPGDVLRGVLAGLGAAAVGALVWALIVYLTHYEVGIVALGVGFAVGYAMHRAARVASIGLAVAAAGIAAVAILLGFALAQLIGGASQLHMGFLDAVDLVSNEIGWGTFLSQAVTGADWLFLALGAFSAFRLVAQQRRR